MYGSVASLSSNNTSGGHTRTQGAKNTERQQALHLGSCSFKASEVDTDAMDGKQDALLPLPLSNASPLPYTPLQYLELCRNRGRFQVSSALVRNV